jgi:PAS domain S-box-containing protein
LPTPPESLFDTFPGDSKMARVMRAHDWAATPMGDPHAWPESIKASLRLMLTARFSMWMGWGPELYFFYNDAYAPTLGIKHPAALGQPTKQVWAEIYDGLSDRFDAVIKRGEATWDQDLLLLLERGGYPEETYHTFSYSPVWGPKGAIDGLICIVSEDTEKVISERRLATLATLARELLPVRTREALAAAFDEALAGNRSDFPFAQLHYLDRGAGDDGPWPFADALLAGEPIVVDLAEVGFDAPTGAWDRPASRALIAPVAKTGQGSPVAALVFGINPYAQRDDGLAAFAKLVAGQVSGALAMADARLREAQEIERLRQLFEQSPSFIAILRGPQHRFEMVNTGYMRLIAHRNVIGMSVRRALPEIVGQGFYELLDKVFTTGEPFVGHGVPVTINATPGAPPEPRFVDFVYQPIRDEAGEITGIFVEGVDVTLAHEGAAALRESEAQFRTLAQAMPNQVWMSQPDGQLNWFNDLTYAYSGAPAGSLDGSGWAAIVHPDDIAAAAERWSQSLSSGVTYETEFRLRRHDGLYRWHLARAVPLFDDQGGIAGWVGTNTDIEDQKATVEALADLNLNLEVQVHQRTAELMAVEETLRQSQKMEAVGQLTGGIAHDFNNMLGVVIGSLDLLGRRLDLSDARNARYLKAATDGANRAAVLTQRLLAFSRQQPLQPEAIEPNRLVSNMSDLLTHALGGAVQLQTVLGAGVWRTFADPNQLENVILNLAVNARDAMSDSGRLTIETQNAHIDERYAAEHVGLSPGHYVLIAVTDTGEGMSEDVIAKAFDPFFTTKEVGKGTGLGLSQVYGFVKQSGGHVKIYSEIGVGTSVKIYLPRHTGNDDAAAMRGGAAGLLKGDESDLVLVVEDEAAMRQYSVDALRDLGYRVIEAADADQALALITQHPDIKLLFTDVVMPGINGAKLAAAAARRRPDLKVLFTTGYTRNAVVHNGVLDAGVQLIGKPFTVEALATKLREVLDA